MSIKYDRSEMPCAGDTKEVSKSIPSLRWNRKLVILIFCYFIFPFLHAYHETLQASAGDTSRLSIALVFNGLVHVAKSKADLPTVGVYLIKDLGTLCLFFEHYWLLVLPCTLWERIDRNGVLPGRLLMVLVVSRVLIPAQNITEK